MVIPVIRGTEWTSLRNPKKLDFFESENKGAKRRNGRIAKRSNYLSELSS
jgi:hypothetical protein